MQVVPRMLYSRHLWLGVALTLQISTALMPHNWHFSLHLLGGFLALMTSAFYGGLYYRDLIIEQTAQLLKDDKL